MLSATVPLLAGETLSATALNERAFAGVLADVARAGELARAALALAQRDDDVVAQVRARLTLALIALREAEIGPGLVQLQEAERLLALKPDPRSQWIAQHVRAQSLRRQGRVDEALAMLAELHGHAALRPVIDAFFTVTALGIAQGLKGQHDESLASFYEALKLARRSGHVSVEVNALNNLGSLQLDLYNLEDARPLLEQCLAGALQLGSRRQVIFAAGNLVQCLGALGQAPQALALVREHLIPLIREDDGPTLQRDEEIAHALIDNGLWDEAEAYLARAPRRDVLTNTTTACRAWLEARILLARDRPGEALARSLQFQADDDGDESIVPIDRLHQAEIAAEAARQVGDYRIAYEQKARAYAIKDHLLGRAAKARLISLQIEHQLQRTLDERDAAQQLARRLEQTNATLQAQVAANEILQRQLRSLALEDPLTGLYNRRFLFQAGGAALEQARRQRHALAVALIDLDHFKAINDCHGHDCGDRVLQAFAELARSTVRASDICCRYGGEEFVIVLAPSDAETAARRVRDLLATFAAQHFASPGGRPFACSFSAGISESRAGGDGLAELLRRADQALYRAKDAGRGRVEIG